MRVFGFWSRSVGTAIKEIDVLVADIVALIFCDNLSNPTSSDVVTCKIILGFCAVATTMQVRSAKGTMECKGTAALSAYCLTDNGPPMMFSARQSGLRVTCLALTAISLFSLENAHCMGNLNGGTDDARIPQLITPRSGRELILNFKTALQNRMLLPVEFYSTDNLRKFFNAERVVRLSDTDTNIYAKAYGFAYLPVKDDSTTSAGVTRDRLNSELKRDPNGQIYATASVSCSCEITPVEVETVMGMKPTSIEEARPIEGSVLHPTPAIPRSSAPMGNKWLHYEIDSGLGIRSKLSIRFDFDGHVDEIDATQREAP